MKKKKGKSLKFASSALRLTGELEKVKPVQSVKKIGSGGRMVR